MLKEANRQFTMQRASVIGACLIVTFVFAGLRVAAARVEKHSSLLQEQIKKATRTRYQINFTLDFDGRSFTGTEHVRWVNRDEHSTSVLYFHLYANLRSETARNESNPNGADATVSDEPRLEVSEVRSARTRQPLSFTLDDQAVLLRIQMPEAVAPGTTTEVEIKFKGRVPEIDPEETGLLAHIVQQVDAALRDRRETRRARDTNFFSRGVMLLSTAYPVLAVRTGSDWQRKVEASVGDYVFTEVADYDVAIDAPSNVALFTSGEARRNSGEHKSGLRREFGGESLRNFAIIAGRTLQSAERTVGGVKVRSVWLTDHEKVGRHVLDVASEALQVYVNRFGALPYEAVSVAEAPLVAGLGSAEFAGLNVIASAFYVDFDSPAVRNLPEVVREQRMSVEDSLEFTVAHVVAHQWWGITVGNAPERAPVLDEALSQYSALLYYKEARGPERAAQVLDDQLRGVYEIYRTFGGEDMAADRATREYRNSFQYAAIVSGKGALMFAALRRLMGDEQFFTAIRRYYEANRFEIVELDDLRGAFIAETPVVERRSVIRALNRWLSEKHGDEDIAPPNPQLAAALGISTEPSGPKDRNAFSRLGRFFWRQMTRIR